MTPSNLTTDAAAKRIRITHETLVVELRDGRSVSVPLSWYPRLAEGRPSERRKWEIVGPGIGIHWPDLDEDISVEGLLLGLPSGESAASLRRWRTSRRRAVASRKQPTRPRSRSRALHS